MSTTKTSLRYVSIGSCMEGEQDLAAAEIEFKCCAVTKEKCHDDEFFLSGQDISMLTAEENHPAFGKCTMLEQVGGGRCQDDSDLLNIDAFLGALCMNGLPQSCHNPQAMLDSSSIFNFDSVGCNLVNDSKSNDGNDADAASTQYSKCEYPNDEGFVCRWDASSCPDSSTGLLPYQSNGDCPCEKVQTGACIYNDNKSSGANAIIDCAVAPSSCGADSTFLATEELHMTYNVDCRLCHHPSHDQMVDPPPKQNNNTTMAPTPTSSSSDDGLSNGGVIAVTIVVVLLLLTLVPLSVYFLCRRCQQQSDTNSGVDTAVKKEASPDDLKLAEEDAPEQAPGAKRDDAAQDDNNEEGIGHHGVIERNVSQPCSWMFQTEIRKAEEGK